MFVTNLAILSSKSLKGKISFFRSHPVPHPNIVLTFFSWFDGPNRPRTPHVWGPAITLRHTTLGRTPLGE